MDQMFDFCDGSWECSLVGSGNGSEQKFAMALAPPFCEGTCNGRSDVTMMVLAMAPARVPSVYLVLKYARTLVMARVRVSAMDQK